jgi:hypothetical protein
MDPKPRPQHEAYLHVLRALTPQQRLQKAFEMSDFTKALFKQGLRQRFPHFSEMEIHRLFLDRLAKCHNSNY